MTGSWPVGPKKALVDRCSLGIRPAPAALAWLAIAGDGPALRILDQALLLPWFCALSRAQPLLLQSIPQAVVACQGPVRQHSLLTGQGPGARGLLYGRHLTAALAVRCEPRRTDGGSL